MFSKFFSLLVLFAVIVFVSSCGTLPTDSPGLVGKDDQNQTNPSLDQRQRQLQDISVWQLNARFSFVTDKEAWSGRLHWQQQANGEYFIQFSDPAGQGAMQLLGNEQMVELRLADGKNYQAEDADSLLRRETDWELPIKSLWYWIRGLPDPRSSLKSDMDGKGLPVKFEQQGWIINYHSYHQFDNGFFPRKIVMEKEMMNLKLIIMNWTVE